MTASDDTRTDRPHRPTSPTIDPSTRTRRIPHAHTPDRHAPPDDGARAVGRGDRGTARRLGRPRRAGGLAAPLTNLAHLDFLLDEATPPAGVAGTPPTGSPRSRRSSCRGPTPMRGRRHVRARRRRRPLDPVDRILGSGRVQRRRRLPRRGRVPAPLAADRMTSRAATSAYELLRSVAYFQTADGPNAGNVVLWMQPDGDAQPVRRAGGAARPVRLRARATGSRARIWALGEGYAAFAGRTDPEFAAFLEERLALSVDALNRQVLVRYGEWARSDGMRVPAWLIVDGADASAEAVLGLAARVEASRPTTRPPRRRCASSPRGSPPCRPATRSQWPYGAILPWAESRSMWHAWGSQMPAALAVASEALGDAVAARRRRAGCRRVHADADDRGRAGQRMVPDPDRPRADRVRRRLAGAVAARRGRRHGIPRLRRPRRDAGGVVLRREPGRRADVRPGDRRRRTTASSPTAR